MKRSLVRQALVCVAAAALVLGAWPAGAQNATESLLQFGGSSADNTWVNTNMDPDDLQFPLSFSIWAYWFDDGTTRNKIWGWFYGAGSDRGEVEVVPGDVFRLVWWGHDRVNAAPFASNEWVHIGVVMTESQARLYLNGALMGTTTTNPISDGHNIWIGARPNNAEDSFAGYLNNWMIFDGDVGDTGMMQLASGVTPGTVPLLQHLEMQEGQGDTVFDLSGNGNDGILETGGAGGQFEWVQGAPAVHRLRITPGSVITSSGSAVDLVASLSNPTGAITYQWYVNGQEISGATDSSYTIADAQQADEGAYHVEAEDEQRAFSSPIVAVNVWENVPAVGVLGLALLAGGAALAGGVYVRRRGRS